jgi:hypothetical protein
MRFATSRPSAASFSALGITRSASGLDAVHFQRAPDRLFFNHNVAMFRQHHHAVLTSTVSRSALRSARELTLLPPS